MTRARVLGQRLVNGVAGCVVQGEALGVGDHGDDEVGVADLVEVFA